MWNGRNDIAPSQENTVGTLAYDVSGDKRTNARTNTQSLASKRPTAKLSRAQRALLMWLHSEEEAIRMNGVKERVLALERYGLAFNQKKYLNAEVASAKERASISRTLRRLEARALLIRVGGTPGARRTTHVRLTSLGRAEAARLQQADGYTEHQVNSLTIFKAEDGWRYETNRVPTIEETLKRIRRDKQEAIEYYEAAVQDSARLRNWAFRYLQRQVAGNGQIRRMFRDWDRMIQQEQGELEREKAAIADPQGLRRKASLEVSMEQAHFWAFVIREREKLDPGVGVRIREALPKLVVMMMDIFKMQDR